MKIIKDILRIKEYITTCVIVIAMSNKTTVILSDKSLKKVQQHKISMQLKSTKNITFTDALNDICENLKI